MKKSTFSKIALTIAGALFASGAMAQGAAADYSLISADGIPNSTYVTQGKAVPVYVQPDGVYHPSWVFPSTGLTAGFTWVFTSAAIPANITLNQPSTLNYAEFTGVTVGGPYAVNVYEQAPAAYGGCHDAGIDFNVFVTGKPTAAMTGSLVAPWTVDAATATGTTAHICGDQAAENLSVAITETGAPAAIAGYAYYVQKRSVNIDVAGVEIGASVVTSGLVDHTTAAKYHGAGPEVISTGALNVLNSKRTKYTFTLMKASDLPGATAEGIVSAISQKSDYVAANGIPTLAQITTYPFTTTSTTVEYIVNPTPVTGPVFHIANNFAY